MIVLLTLALTLVPQTSATTLKSDDPAYELNLPPGYESTIPVEKPPRFIRSTGPERWAKITTQVAPMSQPLPQNSSGVTAEQILPLISLPPEATWTFSRTRWKDLDVGVIKYHAVVGDLPVIGLAAVLPLTKKGLRITVYGADPLDKEIGDDFEQMLSRVTKAETDWYTEEMLGKMATMKKVSIGGAVLAALYLIAWVILFRGNPHGAHWIRAIWLFGIAVVLFIPVTSTGPTTVWNNLLVNALLPLFFLVMTARRLKMGVDAD